jgi:hypothetical protein
VNFISVSAFTLETVAVAPKATTAHVKVLVASFEPDACSSAMEFSGGYIAEIHPRAAVVSK